MKNCRGDGECLEQCNNGYIKSKNIKCNNNCIPVKCKNYIICGTEFPEMYIGCWGGKGCCLNCDIMFGSWGKGKGILKTNNNIECPICLEDEIIGIEQPNCDHCICISCFKKSYYCDNNDDDPPFPYPEIEDEWDDDQSNPKWEKEYPLIEKWNDEINKLIDEREEKRELLSKCCICRK